MAIWSILEVSFVYLKISFYKKKVMLTVRFTMNTSESYFVYILKQYKLKKGEECINHSSPFLV